MKRTWFKRFYPVPANKVSKRYALDHSIRKWRGLQWLKKRGELVKGCDSYQFLDIPPRSAHFFVDSSTCALCVHHFEKDWGNCYDCPLFKVRGNVSCDRTRYDENKSPYTEFTQNGNPLPMLEWLLKAKRMVEKKRKAKP